MLVYVYVLIWNAFEHVATLMDPQSAILDGIYHDNHQRTRTSTRGQRKRQWRAQWGWNTGVLVAGAYDSITKMPVEWWRDDDVVDDDDDVSCMKHKFHFQVHLSESCLPASRVILFVGFPSIFFFFFCFYPPFVPSLLQFLFSSYLSLHFI